MQAHVGDDYQHYSTSRERQRKTFFIIAIVIKTKSKCKERTVAHYHVFHYLELNAISGSHAYCLLKLLRNFLESMLFVKLILI